MLSSPVRASALLLLFTIAIGAGTAAAQEPDVDPERQPISLFAADVRGVFANYYSEPTIAPFLGVTQDNIAKRGLGVAAGANVYPLRLGRIRVGFGGELMFSRGRKTIKIKDPADPEEEIDGPTVSARLSSVLPNFSLNFGRRAGWSYVSAGLGWVKYSTQVEPDGDAPSATPAPGADEATPRTSMLHYGGGARWFAKERLAFCFDIRYYAIDPQAAAARRPVLPRKRLVMLSAGVSFR
jgi:hypothetical protein